MTKITTRRPSAYDRLPGLRAVNRGQGTSGGAVKSALRGLGYDEGAQALAPSASESAPSASSPLQDTGLRGMLSRHLVASGRSNGDSVGGQLGGARSGAADQRRERHAKRVLVGMESATQENQRNTPEELKRTQALTHAYAAHGPESDQIGRLVHGRRADEEGAQAATNTVTLSGNGGLGDYTTSRHTTVGSGASNTSGAFRDNFSMLRVTNEAFAQASQVDAYASQTRRGGGSTSVDDERFATTMAFGADRQGTPDAVGYNLSISGHSKQQRGAPLAKDEMTARYAAIQRDDGMTSATVVLDPSYNAQGKRVGWNLQTAYANKNEAEDTYANPAEVGGKGHEKSALVETLKRQVAELKSEAQQAKTEARSAAGLVKGKTSKLRGMKGRLAKEGRALQAVISEPTSDPVAVDEARKELRQHEQAVTDAEQELAAAKQQSDTASRASGEKAVELKALGQKLKAAVQDLKSHQAGGSSGGSDAPSARTPDAGYNPLTGEWDGDRPEKPSEYDDQLKGVDVKGKALTAHHLYPWNQIREDLNAALAGKNKAGLQRLLMFGGVTVDDDFWVELAKDPPERNYAFAETLNLNMGKICWSPSNVMMGPGGRMDDPGEKVDARFGPDGLPTHQSALAELLANQGGLHKSGGSHDQHGGLAHIMLRNLREQGVGQAHAYDSADWGYSGGKPYLKQSGVEEVGGKRVDARKKWVNDGGQQRLLDPTKPANKHLFPKKKGGK